MMWIVKQDKMVLTVARAVCVLCLLSVLLSGTARSSPFAIIQTHPLDGVPQPWVSAAGGDLEVRLLWDGSSYKLQLAVLGPGHELLRAWPMEFQQPLNIKTWAYIEDHSIVVASEQPYRSQQHLAAYRFDGESLTLLRQWSQDPSAEALALVYAHLDAGAITEAACVLENIMYPQAYYRDADMAARFLTAAHSAALKAFRENDPDEAADLLGAAFGLHVYAATANTDSRPCYENSPLQTELPFSRFLVILNDYGFFLEQAGRLWEAADVLKTVLTLDPERTAAMLNYGDTLWELYLYYQSLPYYQSYTDRMQERGLAESIPERGWERLQTIGELSDAAMPPKDNVVVLEDPVLEALVRQALAIPFGPIRESAAGKLHRLAVNCEQVTSLQGIEQLSSLQHLVLAGNRISDLSPLSRLPQLHTLHLSSANIRDISPLEPLQQLRTLHLHYSQVEDLRPLRRLHQLTDLYLDVPYAQNFQPLESLTELASLDIAYRELSDLSFLQELKALQHLMLHTYPIDDLEVLAPLDHLETLYVPYHTADTLAPLQQMTVLRDLNLGIYPIASLAALEELSELRSLTMVLCCSEDLAVVGRLRSLQELALHGSGIDSLDALATLTALNRLQLGSNHISDISPLASLQNLEYLDLTANDIADLSALSGLTGLRQLYLNHNPISDLTPLLKDPGFGLNLQLSLCYTPAADEQTHRFQRQVEELRRRGAAVWY